MAESLTSYISRVALAHCVTVGTLVAKEVALLINKPYLTDKTSTGMSTQFTFIARTVNGIGITATDWVNAMQDTHTPAGTSVFNDAAIERSAYR